ncbi:MAG: peptidylprolyl isomerase, partial [Gemmatimonadetes bacterium]|nr:peptidylprolyl isomerase [Gemmatimonadota bacterium]
MTAPAARVAASNLTGSSKALLVAALADRCRRGKSAWGSLLVVTASTEAADSMAEDLRAFLGEGAAAVFPAWETLPFEERAPHPDIAGERLEFLARLVRADVRVGVVPARALQELVLGAHDLGGMVLKLRVGDRWDRERLLARLVELGFEREPMVSAVGEFSARGGIVDLYGFGMAAPVRIELDGDEITLLRVFDIGTQRSVEPQQKVTVLPAREPRSLWGAEVQPAAPGSARQRLVSPASYLPAHALVVFDEPEQVEREWEEYWAEVLERHAEASAAGDSEPDGLEVAPPDTSYAPPDTLRSTLRNRRQLRLHALHMGGTGASGEAAEVADQSTPEGDAAPGTSSGGGRTIRFATRDPEPIGRDIERLRGVVATNHDRGLFTTIFCDNLGQLERLEEILADGAAHAQLAVGTVTAGFRLPDERLAVYTDHEIFERQRRIPRRVRYRVGAPLESFTDIHPGDFLVHIDYGIGRFLGIEKLELSGGVIECLALRYADGDKLYVPVDRLSLVEKYTSEDGTEPRLHRLGAPTWERQKARTRRAIEDMTEELLELYAQRELDRGFAFSSDTAWQRALESSFLYEDTADQASATVAIKADMESRRPMDRLLCGDVGYGKTEVAIRAAFKAVQDGRQVAVLVPTTILAEQHLTTFRERLADFPVRVEALSRFRSRKEQLAALKDLARGDVDIVIGTHRLLSKDVAYHDLGLVVVDEEQRFGVKQKEQLRRLKGAVDVLTLTATPIPRTLYFSLSGIRDMSLLQTPPRDRIPVVTTIATLDEDLIRDALRRELDRDGQVFFIHNRVETIDEVARLVGRLVPEARMEVAHGQMKEGELEGVMLRFFHGDVDVLVCTTIVESGLDVPRANTLIVNRADRFGLSELYQLRGRVGRSHRRAYAYFLAPPRTQMTEEAEKRLRVLEEYSELGAGYQIALKDLEMRRRQPARAGAIRLHPGRGAGHVPQAPGGSRAAAEGNAARGAARDRGHVRGAGLPARRVRARFATEAESVPQGIPSGRPGAGGGLRRGADGPLRSASARSLEPARVARAQAARDAGRIEADPGGAESRARGTGVERGGTAPVQPVRRSAPARDLPHGRAGAAAHPHPAARHGSRRPGPFRPRAAAGRGVRARARGGLRPAARPGPKRQRPHPSEGRSINRSLEKRSEGPMSHSPSIAAPRVPRADRSLMCPALLAVLFALTACKAGPDKAAEEASDKRETPLAVVGDDTVSAGEVAAYMGAVRSDRTREGLKRAVDDLVAVELAKDAAKGEKMTPEQSAARDIWRDQLMIGQLRDSVIFKSISVPDSAVESFYRDRIGEEVKARHVLVTVSPTATPQEKQAARARAEEALAKARKGEDFEKLSRAYSEGTTAATGGELGWFGKGDMVPAFEKAAFELQPNEVSGVVETRFGYHVIKVEDKRKKTLEEVRPQILEALSRPRQREAEERYVDKMVGESGLEFYESNVDTLVALFQADSSVPDSLRNARVVARWNGGPGASDTWDDLTIGEIVERFRGLPQENQAAVRALDTRDKMVSALTPLVKNSMLISRATAAGLELDPDRQQKLDDRVSIMVVQDMLRRRVQDEVAISDSAVDVAYRADSAKYGSAEEARPAIRRNLMQQRLAAAGTWEA